MSKMPLSLYSVINSSRIIFTIIMSVIILGENLTVSVIIGFIIIIIGLILVNKQSDKNNSKEAEIKVIFILLGSCLLSSISGIIDKSILKSINTAQMQFWFLLFLTILYGLIILIGNKKIDYKNLKKNYWIPITAICLVVGDRFLFVANEIPESKVSIMTLIKQISVIEQIIVGKILFKEKNIIKKLLCSLLIIIGVIFTLL